MTDLLQQLVTYIGDNPSIAGFVVFMVAMGEALFIVGLFVPSTVVLVGAGTLVGLGKLEAWPIFFWTTFGAIVGDAISYWVGFVYKDRLKRLWPLSRYESLVVRGEEYFKEHGGKSVFIGRFVPGVKSVVPGIAGMVGMDAWRFTVINVVSAFAWAITHLGPGFFAGTILNAIGQISTRLALVIGALFLIILMAVMLGRWLILIVIPLFPGAHAAIVGWFANRQDRLSQWIALHFDPLHPRSTGMLVSALLLLVTMPAFFWIMGEISPGEPMVRADLAILNMFDALRTPLGDQIMVWITMLGDGVVVSTVTAVAAGYLILRKAWRRAAGFIIAMAGTAIFVPVVKTLLHRSRPMELYAGADAFSFPSGHATLNAVLFGILAVLIAHDRKLWIKAAVFTVTTIYVIAIGFSRIYLGAHWASDVLAGLIFGLAMVSAFAFVFGPIHNEKLGRWTLAGLTVLTLGAVGTWHVNRGFEDAMAAYQPAIAQRTLAHADWQAESWKELPARRMELDGTDGEPLIIQYAGTPDDVAEALAAHGWRRPPEWSILSATGFVEGETPAGDLPALPRTQNGRAPKLVLIKDDGKEAEAAGRWVLRLWPTRFIISQDGKKLPVHAGGVLHEKILRPLGEFSGPKADIDAPAAADNPARHLPGALLRTRSDGITVVLASGE